MKSDKNILIAFFLNLIFSIIEFAGGIITGSIAILSDSLHDIGDAMSIGLSFILEKKSGKEPDNKYTYGYVRYSVLGSLITTIILIVGSIFVIKSAINKIINPIKINYNGMIILAIVGATINMVAVKFTKDGHSLNQRQVNLHMLEDSLGWIVVLMGAVMMKATNIVIIDPILSILLAIFILYKSFVALKIIIDLFLEKVPKDLNVNEVVNHLLKIKGVKDVHHIHVRSIDGLSNYATMHVVTDSKYSNLKVKIKEELKEFNIVHSTIEFEDEKEICDDKKCKIEVKNDCHHHHHH